MTTIYRTKIKELIKREEQRYADERPKSRALADQAQSSLIFGVPMAGMNEWAGGFPIYVESANGAYLTDVDGHHYLDLCLGDTGGMCGHTPPATIEAVVKQVSKGMTFWLPTEDSIWVGKELTRRFGLPYWQVYLRASDANIAALSVARDVTQRYPIIVFNGSYHGHVPESRLGLMNDKIWPEARGEHDTVEVRDGVVWRGLHAQGIEPTRTTGTRVIDFNDLDALEKALSTKDIACVLCEPAMTNVGIIMPDPGYHEELRRLTRKYGTLLIIDETVPPGFLKAVLFWLIRIPVALLTYLLTQTTTHAVPDLPGLVEAAGFEIIELRTALLGSWAEVTARQSGDVND